MRQWIVLFAFLSVFAVSISGKTYQDWSWNVCKDGDIVYLQRAQSASAAPSVLCEASKGANAALQFDESDNNTVAIGQLGSQSSESGWHVLSIKTREKWGNGEAISAQDQGFWAGYLEGILTQEGIASFAKAVFDDKFAYGLRGPSAALIQFYEEHIAWARNLTAPGSGYNEQYKQHLLIVLSQLDGMAAALKGTAADKWSSLTMLYILNSDGDLEELIPKFHREILPKFDEMSAEEIELALALRGHCSAAVKLAPNATDVYAGHSTWSSFSHMARIFKTYQFGESVHISFSSYPGIVSSVDDYYQMHHSQMVMLETTNSFHNHSLYDMIVPQSLLSWQRVRVANGVADSGKSWYEAVALHNSGTYNNQYIIVDYKLFQKGQGLLADGVWVIEQCPGLSMGRDISAQIMHDGYYASYNVPFFKEIADASGWTDLANKHGDEYTYEGAPRGQLFRLHQSSAHDFGGFKSLLRHNDYKNDKVSKNNPWRAICSRGDLFDIKSISSKCWSSLKPVGCVGRPIPVGCTDTKATSGEMFAKGVSAVINGPTTAGGLAGAALPAFSWTIFQDRVPHPSFPHTFNFDFVEVATPFLKTKEQ